MDQVNQYVNLRLKIEYKDGSSPVVMDQLEQVYIERLLMKPLIESKVSLERRNERKLKYGTDKDVQSYIMKSESSTRQSANQNLEEAKISADGE